MPTPEHKTATSTEAVHAGDVRTKPFDSISQPVVMTATYSFEGTREIIAMKEGRHARADREEYGRYGNPTCRALELRLAALEGCEDALLFATGMAAVTTSILALVKAGQHVIIFNDGYRMTREFVTRTLMGFGIEHTVLPAGEISQLPAAIRPTTRLIVSESPTNPYLRCLDLEALARVASAHRGVKTLIDATFATPYNCRPASFGVDLVVHSATKYLAGHNDVLAGVVSGRGGLVSLVRDLRSVLGSVCDPHAAFLVARGLKTLALRVERQNATALTVARHLERHAAVERVHYPGLASHPDHATAAAQMTGFGGVVSFEVKGGLDAACRVVDRMKVARMAPSLGGVESLVEVPAVMSYFELTPAERGRIGIAEGLVRLAVGIEDAADVLADLDGALGGSDGSA
jgi:cystathionine gamma-synthase